MKRLVLIFAGLLVCLAAFAQKDKADVRRGNREFRRGHFQEADIFYRRALLADSTSIPARYNLAGALYKEGNLDEAGKELAALNPRVLDSPWAADWWFNTGDVALGQKDYGRAVEAFREVLLRQPDNMEAKENYVYARLMQQNQEQQGGGSDQNQQDQEQDQDQDQNEDQQDQNQGQNQDDEQDGEGQQPQPQEVNLSPQQIQQMLRAIQVKEQETQDKVNREKAEAAASRQRDKNW